MSRAVRPFVPIVIVIACGLLIAPARAGLLDGLAAAGDSLTDEYEFQSYSYAHNWLEQLAVGRSLNFGTKNSVGSGWGEPRRRGYEHNWARAGGTTSTLLSQGQHTGLAAQVTSGDVTLAMLAIGANDFGNSYSSIYSGALAGTALGSFINTLAGRIDTALSTIESAGPVEVILATIPDYGFAPAFRAFYTDPVGRQRVSDATVTANVLIRELASSRSLPLVDLFAAGNVLFATDQIIVGGAAINYGAATSPTTMFVDDGIHPHSVLQGLIANLVIEAANRAYGAGLAPFTDQELLTNAGIVPPIGGPTYFPMAPYVLFEPVPGDATLDGQVTGADYTVWADHFGLHPGNALYRDGDFTGDGFVTGADFTIWADHFGEGTAPAQSVPEPQSIMMAVLALGAGIALGLRSRLIRK